MIEYLILLIFAALQAQKKIGKKPITKLLSYPSSAVCPRKLRYLLRNGGLSIFLCSKFLTPIGMRNLEHKMYWILLRFNHIPQLKLMRRIPGSNPVFHPDGGILLLKPNICLKHEEDDELEYGDLFQFFKSQLYLEERPIFSYPSLGLNTPIKIMVMHPSGKLFFMGCYDIRGTYSLVCYRFAENYTTVCYQILSGHNDTVDAIGINPAGSIMVTASSDNQGILWNISADGQTITRTRMFDIGICAFCIAFHPDKPFFAIGGHCNDVILYRIDDSFSISRFSCLIGHESYVYDVKILKKDVIVTASADDTIKIWKISSRTELVNTINVHTNRVRCLCFDSSEHMMFSASLDGKLFVWWLSDDNLLSAKQIQVLEGDSDGVEKVVLDPSGRSVVSAGNDSLILWE